MPGRSTRFYALYARATWAPLSARLAPSWVLCAVVYAVFQQVIDFRAWHEALATQPWPERALLWLAACALWLAWARGGLRGLLLRAADGCLWRLPLGRWTWAPPLLAVGVLMAWPLGALALLSWPRAPLSGLGIVALASLLGATSMQWHRRSLGVAIASLAAVLLLAQAQTLGPWLGQLLALGAVVGVARTLPPLVRLQRSFSDTAAHTRVARATWLAVLQLDGLTLWRCERRLLLLLVAAYGAATVLLWRLLSQGVEARLVLQVLVALTSPLAFVTLLRLCDSLGILLGQRRWGRRPAARVASLVGLTAAPNGLLLVAAGALGASPLAGLAGGLASLAVASAAVACALARRVWPSSSLLFPYTALALFFVGMLPPAASLVIDAAVCSLAGAVAWALLRRGD